MSKVPILTYHSIDNSGSVISTSPERFRSQMRYLAESSFNVISLREIATLVRENRPFPPKTVAITFDDGFKNIYDLAFPVLKKFGFKATVFLVTGYCGRNNQWNGQPEWVPSLDLLNWNEVVEMSNNGIDFGAHTMSHPNLSKLLFQQATIEIVNSKSMIREHLGKDTMFFAYPYGEQTKEIKCIVKDEFYGACSSELGFVTLNSDIYSLSRIDMYYFSRNSLFRLLDTPFFSSYIQWRSILRSFNPGNGG